MVGTSTTPNTFTKEIVQEMAAHTKRPMIFPLSNPTKLAEAKAADLIEWTDGRALVAKGIPAENVSYKGVSYAIGQANNALIYPGLGLGIIATKSKLLTDSMISAAAHALNGMVDTSVLGAAVLPPVSSLTKFSEDIAIAVGEEVVKSGLNQEPISDVRAEIIKNKWIPEYKELEE